jgi:hypothetical protein
MSDTAETAKDIAGTVPTHRKAVLGVLTALAVAAAG